MRAGLVSGASRQMIATAESAAMPPASRTFILFLSARERARWNFLSKCPVMQVTLLGTGSPIPAPDRAGAATLVRAGGTTLLVDCGRGVALRLTAAGVLPPMLSAVFLTHLHSDHITDLNDVITTHWVMCPTRTELPLYGPHRTQEVVDGTLAMLGPDVEYRLAHHEDLNWG